MGEQTREKILNAALLEFVEKGFDEARVEDVAKRAGLTKVMLYYHFSSKENLMIELMARLSTEITEKFRENLSDLDIRNPQSVRDHAEGMLDYLSGREEVIRLMISESIKGKNGHIGSLSIFEEFFKAVSSIPSKDSDKNSDRDKTYHNQLLVRIFFFNMLPMAIYSGLSNQFNNDFGIDARESRKVFVDTFINVLHQNIAEE